MSPIWPFLIFAMTIGHETFAQPSGKLEVVNLRDLNIPAPIDIIAELYREECAVCHGDRLQGSPQGTALVGGDLLHGNSLEAIANSTANGFDERGMPGFSAALSNDQLWAVAIYIKEQR